MASVLKQVAIIGFDQQGEIVQVKQLSLDLASTDLNAAKQVVEQFLNDDSDSVKVVLCKSKDVIFHDTNKVIERLKEATTQRVLPQEV
ncbi:hypothetical protein A1QO_02675 [Vibrio genomosp. F10 str. ZF-129]|uniref:Uncharacterized protein n=1 Tax=Vibrio genomosp. F10 str. ZF-129 TaxID=1187848 RepID=A0A1E5BKC5_9VIBR|nr:hypothetical protein [Vibrio genomosp. F10]OEE38302.1 hypothetical protein A1QO_02675 [Vibrio genomosp. F10 str. ZF-129]